MSKRSIIASATLALAMSAPLMLPAQAEEPALNQDRLQQQIRDRAMTQQDMPADARQQMRQEQRENATQNRSDTRSVNRQENRPSAMGEGGHGAGGMGGGKHGGR